MQCNSGLVLTLSLFPLYTVAVLNRGTLVDGGTRRACRQHIITQKKT